MPPRQTVLLFHETPAGDHYDWLLEDPTAAALPGEAEPRLWAARVKFPSDRWAELGTWDLEPIAPHRRLYLTYEGPIAQAPPPDGDGSPRGTVKRVDEGTFEVREWGEERIVIDLKFKAAAGRVEIVRVSQILWRATLRAGR
ncbi:MAG: hypothetical protein NTW19_14565 [Planctomycetota bacterium]|nr:hypothetical protein [Planctomycetota bacterium]